MITPAPVATNDAQETEKLQDARVAALRKAVMRTAPSPSITASSSTNLNNANPSVAKNQAWTFVREMMKDSWIAQTNAQLLTDIIPALEGGCIYLPGFLCAANDFSILKGLTRDLQYCPASKEGGGFVTWSQHLKFENPGFSPTFQQLLARLDAYFDVEILATRLNFYRDGSDFKPFHHDSHAYGTNGKKEDFTMGASFGSTRKLAFRHEVSGQTFTIAQANGDIFAFDSEVNRAFTHGVPKIKGGAEKAGPRFSIIAWGRRRTLNERNSTVTARETDKGQRQEKQEGGREGGHRGYGGGGRHRQRKKEAGKEGGKEEGDEVMPIGMDEVARLVEKMVMKADQKQAREALLSSSSHAGGGGRGKDGGGGGSGGKSVGGEAAAMKENTTSENTSGSSSSSNISVMSIGRTRRAGRVQHSWTS
ncbi:oxoglutarate iron-dependent oxygenase [Nannochloropsis oceanica]